MAEVYSSPVKLSSSCEVREFITQRLTAAAGEIFSIFEETILRYEAEIIRQRSLLSGHRSPRTAAESSGDPQQHVYKEEKFLSHQQLCNQERSSNPHQQLADFSQIKDEEEEKELPYIGDDHEKTEPPQIKAEPEEPCSGLDGAQLELNQETCVFMQNPLAEEGINSDPEGDREQNECPVVESQEQSGFKHLDPGLKSTPKPHKEHVENSVLSENMCDTNSDKKSSRCDFCGKTFADFYKLEMHRRLHVGAEELSCKTCGKDFIQEEHLKTHRCDNIHSCKICGKSFSNSSHLLYHTRSHSGEKPYSCKMCGKGFRESRYLLNHIRTHTGEMPYTCKMCNKSFKQSRYLLNHMRIHTGEKPYSCKICGRNFGQGSYLIVHMRTHTGEKPYSCGTCGKRFTQQGNLVKHMGTHTSKKSLQ